MDRTSLPADHEDAAFYELAACYLDGRIAAGDLTSLDRQLAADPRKREIFLDICLQAALIVESREDILQGPVSATRRILRRKKTNRLRLSASSAT